MSNLSTKIIILCVLHKTFHFILVQCWEAPTILWCFNFYVLILFWKIPCFKWPAGWWRFIAPPPPPPPHSHATILRHVRLCTTELLESLPVKPKQKATRVKSEDAGGKHEFSKRLSWTCVQGNACQDEQNLFRF